MKNAKEIALDGDLNELIEGKITPEQLIERALGAELRDGQEVLILEGRAVNKAPASGTKVALADDATYPYFGLTGRVKGQPKNGFVDVELPNGTTVPYQTTLLYAV